MIVDELRKSILQQAIFGNLSKYIKGDTLIDDYINIVKSNEYIKQKNVTSKFEYFYNIPENWKWVKLGEIVGIYGGKRIPAGRKLTTENTGYKYIRVADMNDITVVTDNILYVPKDIYPLIKNYTISKDDLYITVAGTIGKVGFIPEELDGANLTENANKLVFKNINKKWLFYSLTSPFVKHQIEEFTTKVGQPKLAIKRIENIEIPLPSIEEQQRIVNQIEELFAKLDEIKPIEEELNQLKSKFSNDMKLSLIDYALQGKLTNQADDESSSEFLKVLFEKQKSTKFNKMKNIEKINESTYPYKVPNNWSWERIGNILEINLGFTYRPEYVSTGYKFLSVKDISSGYIDFDNVKYISEKEYNKASYGSKPKKGDILFGRVGTIGCPQIVNTEDPFCIFVSLGFFRDHTNLLNKKYVCYWMNSPLFKKQVAENVSGTAQTNLNSNWLKNFYISLPPIEEQQRIVDKLENLLPLCDDIEKLIKEA